MNEEPVWYATRLATLQRELDDLKEHCVSQEVNLCAVRSLLDRQAESILRWRAAAEQARSLAVRLEAELDRAQHRGRHE
jgi:hypothetical protein